MNQVAVSEELKKYGSMLVKGAVIQLAPGIAKGILLEILRTREVSVGSVSSLVQEKANLWDLAGEHYQESGRRLAERVGDLSWLTTSWVIASMKDDYPAIASLFVGWKKAANWLEKQTNLIKEKLSS